jgi:thymidylate synthase (FAD)
VLEHYNVSVLLYGVSRAFTHELVRHRAGFGFSQVSQRYVAGKHLRFVESLEHQNYAPLHASFERWIDAAAEEYETRESLLLSRYNIEKPTTEQRKAVRQEARRCLPNETEAAIVVTGNLRAWRHLVEQRCSKWADAEACRAAYVTFQGLRNLEPLLWEDYVPGENRPDGLNTVTTPYRKV